MLLVALLGVGLSACSEAPASEDVDAADLTVRAGAEGTFRLVPTASGVADACAPEMGTTFCSRGAAERAAGTCSARLSATVRAGCPEGRCSVPFRALVPGTCVEGRTYPSAEACRRPVADDCSFYRSCLESRTPCGGEGYALGFGERLCYAFVEHDAEFSAEGRAWLSSVRQCLQRELVPALAERSTCAALEATAFATHARCYTASEHSICELPFEDVLRLTGLIAADLFSTEGVAQVRDVALACTAHWLLAGARAPSTVADERGRFFLELAARFSDRSSP